jgi:uncharacterized membrane protein
VSVAERARVIVLALLALLAAALLVWQRARLATGSVLPLLWLVPLLLPLPGLIRGRRYTYAWSTLLVIGYIALALTEIVAAPAGRLLTATILLVAFALFIALVMYLRATRAPPG